MERFALLFIGGVYDQTGGTVIGNMKLSAKVAVKLLSKEKIQ